MNINIYHNLLNKEEKNKFRINYYLGNVNKEIIVDTNMYDIILFDEYKILTDETLDINKELYKYYDKYVKGEDYLDIKYAIHSSYFIDLYNYLLIYKNNNKNINNIDINYLFRFGDSTSFNYFPCFTKAKNIINNDFSVLLKLNTRRHTSMFNEILKVDIPFHLKSNKLIWRGDSTGTGNPSSYNNKRLDIVDKYYNCDDKNIDIKFSRFNRNDIDIISEKVDTTISYKELLNHKFLISIEGNDVATNLKWILLSKSVCLMPKPTKCSWFMEDMLIPFIHYIPLNDDFCDLEEKYKWCLDHLDECEIISQNATKYIEDFLDNENENYITNEVLKGYFNNVKII
jgi:hypothetical protein